jgi:hypothetical protein
MMIVRRYCYDLLMIHEGEMCFAKTSSHKIHVFLGTWWNTVLGVIVLPITLGHQSARMIIADYLKIERHLKPDFAFVIALFLLNRFSVYGAIGQISYCLLWIGTVYLYKRKTFISSH